MLRLDFTIISPGIELYVLCHRCQSLSYCTKKPRMEMRCQILLDRCRPSSSQWTTLLRSANAVYSVSYLLFKSLKRGTVPPFFQVGYDTINSSEDKILKQDMPPALNRVEEASVLLLQASQMLRQDPYSAPARKKLIEGSRGTLSPQVIVRIQYLTLLHFYILYQSFNEQKFFHLT